MGRGASKGIQAGVDDEETRRRHGSRPSSSSLPSSLPPFFSRPLWASLCVSRVVATSLRRRLDHRASSRHAALLACPFSPSSLVADTTPLAAFARN